MTGPITKKRILAGLLPILKDTGANDGAIMVAIDASWLERSLSQSQMSEDAAVAIIDRNGNVVLSRESRPLPKFDVVAGNAHVTDAIASNGVGWMYAVAPLIDRELYVAYAEPKEELMATALKQEQIGLILPIAALLLAMLSIWVGTTRLVLRWLESVRALAAEFAKGNFSDERNKFAKAPREIGLLVRDLHNMANAIEARDSELKMALDVKTAMTQDIHHRVKNNLQIVSSLLNLQTEKMSDPAAREALNQTRARIGALAQIHRLLYEDGHDSDQENVDIAKLLHALCIQLRALHGRERGVILSCEVEPQMIPINHAVPLTLLAVEAVTNAFRHGFPQGQPGQVMVHFDVKDGQATLWVKDDGVGFQSTQAPSSMGQQLMEAFAQQLGGTLHILSSVGTGTNVTLVYPLPQRD
ncbi:sensor histidine kinase [Aquisediminimonas profunda]|uniref:sensor histidine kinase n=1 Tax=Aquisediminimonas profunda TaxID=1550733 RepID=UPI001C62E89C|nr:sensor histidine kinase [Aquisediminimonas profunda]